MTGEKDQNQGAEDTSGPKMAEVLRELLVELTDTVTVSYRDKEDQEIGRTVLESLVDQEHEGCQPDDPRIDRVEMQSGGRTWSFGRNEMEDFRDSY
ncbi:MAG: hypothetical protein HOH43_23665 [Candidatus Latescibacteria bacterium]|nr:hypothetical protein [Candidatus Latescibacterota bacterium]